MLNCCVRVLTDERQSENQIRGSFIFGVMQSIHIIEMRVSIRVFV